MVHGWVRRALLTLMLCACIAGAAIGVYVTQPGIEDTGERQGAEVQSSPMATPMELPPFFSDASEGVPARTSIDPTSSAAS